MNRLKVGVLGSTGIVGQQFVRMLDAHPNFEVVALTSSNKSAGKMYGQVVDWAVKKAMPEYARNMPLIKSSVKVLAEKGVKAVFSALPSAVAGEVEDACRDEGMYVFSNASTHRMNPRVPVLIPEVNPDHLELVKGQSTEEKGFIVTNANCSTAGLVLVLKPLMKFGIRSVKVATYQAVSGAGRRGLFSLDILANIIPYIEGEEAKMEREPLKILGSLKNGSVEEVNLDIKASCCRVPVRDGHLESVFVELDEDVDPETLLRTLSSYRGIPQERRLPTAPEKPLVVREENNRPQPLLDACAGTPERAEGMAVTVGRLRKKGRSINLFLLVHNTVRGAAGTCILNAELAMTEGYMTVDD